MMCAGHFSGPGRMEVLEIHHHPQLLDQCCDLLNMEWPRSKTIRYPYEMLCLFMLCVLCKGSFEIIIIIVCMG
jgi:hypothetical protein